VHQCGNVAFQPRLSLCRKGPKRRVLEQTMATPATESLPRRNSDPIWLQDYFVHTGHDANTRNGTATFVKRKGLHYVCTCRHILESIQDPTVVPNAEFPTLALAVDKAIINLARMTANGPELVMRTPGPETEHGETDIAIAPLDAGTWRLLTTKKNKSAIDLDHWREPNWSTVRFGLACGYPDEHKKNVSANSIDQVANRLITVVAELASTPGNASRTITLHSALSAPHTWYFSGLSGGPLYLVEGLEERQAEDDELFPVGIVFQGYPSSGRSEAMESRDAAAAFLTDTDLFIRALALSPPIFDEWLRDCGF
jgi:hypothetical protein